MALSDREIAVVLKLVAKDFDDRLKKSGGGVDSFIGKINKWKVAATAAIVAVTALARSTANYGDELAKQAQMLGISTGQLAEYNFLADLSGTTTETVATAFRTLAKNALDVTKGTGEAKEAFQVLNVEVEKSPGILKSQEQLLMEVAKALSQYEDGAAKTALVQKILGESGTKLIPFLKGLGNESQNVSKRVEELGLKMSKAALEDSEEFNDAMTELTASIRGLTNTALIPLLPAFTKAIDITTSGIIFLKDVVGSFRFLVGGTAISIAAAAEEIPLQLKKLFTLDPSVRENLEREIVGLRELAEEEKERLAAEIAGFRYYSQETRKTGTYLL